MTDLTRKAQWLERDLERERLVALYQEALTLNDPHLIVQTRNDLLVSILPIIHYQAGKLRPGDEDFLTLAIVTVTERLKYYKGAKRPGTSALGSNIKMWIRQALDRDTSNFTASISESQLRRHKEQAKTHTPDQPLPLRSDLDISTVTRESAPSPEDLLIQAEEREETPSLEELLMLLDETQREVIQLLHLDQVRISDVARHLQLTTHQVRKVERGALEVMRGRSTHAQDH